MAAHQMAALHTLAMRALGTGERLLHDNPSDTVEGCRVLNTAARLIKAYQEGLATLAKIRSGGRQVVTVQHVNVSEGGQAVVAGQVGGGIERRGRVVDYDG